MIGWDQVTMNQYIIGNFTPIETREDYASFTHEKHVHEATMCCGIYNNAVDRD